MCLQNGVGNIISYPDDPTRVSIELGYLVSFVPQEKVKEVIEFQIMENPEQLREEVKNETPDKVQSSAKLTEEKTDHEEQSSEIDKSANIKNGQAQGPEIQKEEKIEEIETEGQEGNNESQREAEKKEAVDVMEEDIEEEKHEEEAIFDHPTREELLSKIKEIKNEEDIQKLDRVLKVIKAHFEELYEIAKNKALQRFISDGNEAEDFEYHGDETDRDFITRYEQLQLKCNRHHKDLEELKEDNLKKKKHLLDQLRDVVDGEESFDSINSVRKLQIEWNNIGSVSGVHNKTLRANYHALIDRYYNNRSIYFELKDLDRKKNLEQKQELCKKAEALYKLEDMKLIIVQLNELHEEYKYIGPVPKEYQESLWQRFKAASDAIYTKRKEHFEALNAEFEINLAKKEALIREMEEFTKFSSDRITEWNTKTKELLDVQKKWEATGGVPKEKAKAINKEFWSTFKSFFAHKNQFFKELESKRVENLVKKQELIQHVKELKDSKEWDSAAQKIKNLQAQWREIGPVPEKVKNELYATFKEACDYFFAKRREQNQEKFKEYDENLKLKLQICDHIEAFEKSQEVNLNDLYDLIDSYNSIGFVPKSAIKKINRRFDEVLGKILSNTDIYEEDRADLKNYIQISKLRNTPGGERKVRRKEHTIRKRISSLENNISTWNTNIEFFANSATASKLKADMQEKIDAAKKEMDSLKIQLASIS